MKKILLLIVISISFINTTQAQIDYCKEIKKKLDEPTGNIEYSNVPMSRLDNLGIEKVVDKNEYGLISITFSTTKAVADYEAKGIFVKFDDGTSLRLRATVICSYLNADDHYLYSAGHLMEDDDLIPFKTKKVIKFILADKEVLINDDYATKFKAWANCIDSFKFKQ